MSGLLHFFGSRGKKGQPEMQVPKAGANTSLEISSGPGKVSWDSAYASASNKGGSFKVSASDSNDTSLHTDSERTSGITPALEAAGSQLSELDLTGSDNPAASSVPESRTMDSQDFARRKTDGRPSFDSARVSGSNRLSKCSIGRHSSSGGIRSSMSPTGAQWQGRLSCQSQVSEHSSGRSSFAMEQVPEPGQPAQMEGGVSRPDAATFGPVAAAAMHASQQGGIGPGSDSAALDTEALDAMCDELGVPSDMHRRFLRLAVLQPNLPIPMSTLRHLWGTDSFAEAEAGATALQERNLMRIACLADGSAWALVQPAVLERLQASCPLAPDVHSEFLASYAEGHGELWDVPDDGYILQAIGYHCVGAQQTATLEKLLQRPAWLHEKLHAYGLAAVVLDFRRYLSIPGSRPAMKLLLEAFQLAMAAWARAPTAGMLQAQLMGRLIAASYRSSTLSSWLADQQAETEAAAAEAARKSSSSEMQRRSAKSAVPKQGRARNLRHLVPATASLTQAGGLLRMLLRGHTAPLTVLLLSPTGTDLITGSEAGELRVWNLDIGDCVTKLEGHKNSVTAGALTPDGSMLVSCSEDATARVWDLQSYKCVMMLAGHTAAINSVAVGAMGRYCVTASADKTARLWSMANGSCVQVLTGHTGSVDMVVVNGKQAVTASEDGTARVWDLTSGSSASQFTLEGHTGWVVAVGLAGERSQAVTASHDCTARVWNLDTGKCIHVLEGHTGRLNSVAVSQDGLTAATASDDGATRVWALKDGSCKQVLTGHGAFVTSCAVSADGCQAVTTSGDCCGRVWRLSDGTCLELLEGHTAPLVAACFTRKCRFAVTASADCTARVWNLLADTSLSTARHTSAVSSVISAPNGHTVVSVADGEALLWEVATGTRLAQLESHTGAFRRAFFRPSGTDGISEDIPPASISPPVVIAAAADQQVVRWMLSSAPEADSSPAVEGGSAALQGGESTELLPAVPGSRLRAFDVSPSGARAVALLWDSSFAVWNLATGCCEKVLHRRLRAGVHATDAHEQGVNGVCFTDEGHVLSWSKDRTARCWTIDDGSSKALIGHSDSVTVAAVVPGGRQCVTGGEDKSCRVFDTVTGAASHELRLPAAPSFIIVRGSVCLVAVGDRVYAFDLESGRRISRLIGHEADVTGTALSADGQLAATCSDDSTLRVWDVTSGRLSALFVADNALGCCTVCEAEGKATIVVGASDGTVHFLPL